MPLPVAAAFLSPSPLTVGTFADAVGKACRVDTEQTGDDKARRVTVKIEG